MTGRDFLFMLLLAVAVSGYGPVPAIGSDGHGKAKEAAKAEAKPFGTRASSSGSESFLQFYPSTATVFSGHRPYGLMHFEYGLDIENARLRDRAVKLAPRLRDAYGRILSQYAGNLYTPGEIPDMDYLLVRMQSATDRIMGRGKAQFLVSTLMVTDN